MKKVYFLGISLTLFLLILSLVSGAWPFSISGKIVDDTPIEELNPSICTDSDGGIFSSVPGIVTYSSWLGGEKTASDTCKSNRLIEYYCNPKSGRVAKKTIKCAFGCEEDENGVGACVIPEPSCEEIENGVKNEKGMIFRNRCDGKTYISYSCDGSEVKESTTECPSKCSVREGGCVGTCSEDTDPENDKDVPGKVIVDGEPIYDKCIGRAKVKQYTCEDSKLKQLPTVNCGENRECISSDNGAYCRDIIAGTETIEELSRRIAELQDLIDALRERIAALEAIVNP